MSQTPDQRALAETEPMGPDGTGPTVFPRSLAPEPYAEVRPIARGGMGIVYRAIDPVLGRPVALKVLAGGADGRGRRRFLREAEILALLEHPNIVPIHELGQTADGRPYLAMPLVRGRTLAELLDDPDGRSDRLLRSFLKVCDAVAFAHSRGIVHRDLKPANVMVGQHGEVLVMDWGIARLRGQPDEPTDGGPAGDGRMTADGAVLGTPAYMSPEQARGRIDEIDERSDVYSLGAILYRLATGRAPFEGGGALVLLEVARGAYPRPGLVAPVSREMEAVIVRAMAVDPADRYRSVLDLAADVDAFLGGRTLAAVDYRPWQVVAKWIGRHRAVSAVAAAGLLAVAAVAGWTIPGWLAEERSRREGEAAVGRLERAALEEEIRRQEARADLELGRRHPQELRLLLRDAGHGDADRRRRTLEAVAAFERALAIDPDLPEAHLGIGQAWFVSRLDPARAAAAFDRAIAAGPDFASPYIYRLLVRLADYQAAVHSGAHEETEAAGALRRAIEADLARVEELATTPWEVAYARGVLAFTRGDSEAARAGLETYLASAPGDAAAHFWLGSVLFHERRWAEAIGPLARAVELDARLEPGLHNLALARGRIGDLAGALAALDRLVEIGVRSVQLHLVRGQTLERLARFDEALGEYAAAAALSPDEPFALLGQARLHFERGDLEASVAAATRLLSVSEQLRAPAYFFRGNARRQGGDTGGAIEDYGRALEIQPDHAEARNNRGLLRQAAGDLDGAIDDFRRALASLPAGSPRRERIARNLAAAEADR